jgi:site-specific DNA-cytosine methylase
MVVRRLTPRECERLQGFPDDYTLIDYGSRATKKKIQDDVFKYFLRAGYSEEGARMAARHPDGPRYKALGNSMAVPVMHWIGKRIQEYTDMVA